MNILPAAEKNILDFIANRLLYTSAIPHKYESVKIIAICNHTEFSANGNSVIESGWNQVAAKTSEDKENAKTLPPVSEEQQFFVRPSKSERFTSPPKPFTEDTLLSAMEHAGQENYADDSEKKGLGTPVTRAATIEGLVAKGYVRRKGKQITATEKGDSASLISGY